MGEQLCRVTGGVMIRAFRRIGESANPVSRRTMVMRDLQRRIENIAASQPVLTPHLLRRLHLPEESEDEKVIDDLQSPCNKERNTEERRTGEEHAGKGG